LAQIWLVRHGESQSQTRESDDHLNPPLSARGEAQAERLIGPLGGVYFDRILISPLQRATQTYQRSGARGRTVQFDSRVIESNWNNPDCYAPLLPYTTQDVALPDSHDAWLVQVDDRARDLVDEFVHRTGEHILLFGHWGVFSQVFMAFLGLSAQAALGQATMDNTGISCLEVNEKEQRYIRVWNDRAHVLDLLD
jgi:broad specificity phosphatase PhoE